MDLNKLLRTQWDRTAAIASVALGAVFLLIGWIGVSGTAYLAEQAPYIVPGGIGGVFLLGIGATLWISADLRDEWRKLDRIERALGDGSLRWQEDAAVVPAARTAPAPAAVPVMAAQEVPVVAPGVTEELVAPARKPAARTRKPATNRTARTTAKPVRATVSGDA
jgi:hypothetical protein